MKTDKVTLFWDMHSGGRQKEKWSKIYIEAPEDEARIIFYNRFGRSPDRVTCTCCGEDYRVVESGDFAQSSAYLRGRETTEEYLENPFVLFIRKEDIKPEERVGEVPQEGYVWH